MHFVASKPHPSAATEDDQINREANLCLTGDDVLGGETPGSSRLGGKKRAGEVTESHKDH